MYFLWSVLEFGGWLWIGEGVGVGGGACCWRRMRQWWWGLWYQVNDIINEDEYISRVYGKIDRFWYYSCWQMLLRRVFIFIIKPYTSFPHPYSRQFTPKYPISEYRYSNPTRNHYRKYPPKLMIMLTNSFMRYQILLQDWHSFTPIYIILNVTYIMSTSTNTSEPGRCMKFI